MPYQLPALPPKISGVTNDLVVPTRLILVNVLSPALKRGVIVRLSLRDSRRRQGDEQRSGGTKLVQPRWGPVGVGEFCVSFSQGSSFVANPGLNDFESLWDTASCHMGLRKIIGGCVVTK